jgi:hypothetical protein
MRGTEVVVEHFFASSLPALAMVTAAATRQYMHVIRYYGHPLTF